MLLRNLINTRPHSIDSQLDTFLSVNDPAIPRREPNGNSPWNQANRFAYRLRGGMDKVVICLFKHRCCGNFIYHLKIHIKLLAHKLETQRVNHKTIGLLRPQIPQPQERDQA